MKHNIKHRKLNRTSSHRKSLLMNLSNSLLKHEQITTTLAKAKELRPFVEKLISLGKKGDLAARKKTISILQDEKMSKKLFDSLADRYKDRSGGYTRIVKLGNRYQLYTNPFRQFVESFGLLINQSIITTKSPDEGNRR